MEQGKGKGGGKSQKWKEGDEVQYRHLSFHFEPCQPPASKCQGQTVDADYTERINGKHRNKRIDIDRNSLGSVSERESNEVL